MSSEDVPVPGTTAGTPRSYIVRTPTGEIRRNRTQLRVMPETTEKVDREISPQTQPRQIMTRSQTGVVMQPPDRLY